ncbi:MAG TPA: alpha/beta hydrolase [Povalibacter sp.]|nr:alpha/beta hydrolase [Povalibacter sp.]
MSYQPRRPPHAERHRLRDLEFQFYRWPGQTEPPLICLHGWGDTAETWQFIVDFLPQRHSLIAFDARGFGRTQWPHEGYWFPDYLADLDAVLDLVAPHQPIDLMGHSMGANVALMYAGIRPQRIRRLIALEGLGLPRTSPVQAPAHYRSWLDELHEEVGYATYDSYEQFARVLARRNPRTPPERLDYIVRAWATQHPGGRVELRADPRHKRRNPMLYQRDQAEACWREIAAPVLFVTGAESESVRRLQAELSPEKLDGLFSILTTVSVADAGHMLHHEQPRAVAELIRDFLR